jgi:alkaline phosphatase
LKARSDDLSLAEFTAAAIRQLEGDRFFMMVEGGKIDWACHANDLATSVREVEGFDQAVRVAVDFAAKHPAETLIIVTADHETGGLSRMDADQARP